VRKSKLRAETKAWADEAPAHAILPFMTTAEAAALN